MYVCSMYVCSMYVVCMYVCMYVCMLCMYRIAGSFCGDFNLVNWRIFYLIAKINSAKHTSAMRVIAHIIVHNGVV